MADAYVDYDLGSGADDGTSWANAYQSSLQSGLTDAGAGGTCWVKTDVAATSKESSASGITLTSPGTISDPTQIVGVLAATTNEPPVEADLLARGTDNLPILERTGSSADITFAGYARVYGFTLITGDEFTVSGSNQHHWIFEQCEIDLTDVFRITNERSFFELVNCDFIFTDLFSQVLIDNGASWTQIGGVTSGGTPNNMFDGDMNGEVTLRGVDLPNVPNVFDSPSLRTFQGELSNCKMKASWTLVDGQGPSHQYKLTAIGCSDTTGKGSGESFQDFIEETYPGTTELETTAIRTGGASDGADGTWGWKLTPNVDSTREAVQSLASPWMEGWVAGDGSTSFTFTVYIANSGAADYNEDDVSLEILTPDAAAGAAQHDHDQGDHATNIIPGSSTAVTDDTDSSWGAGGNNPQKMSVSVTPDFEGPFYARVHFWKTFSSSPETLYVDPLVAIA